MYVYTRPGRYQPTNLRREPPGIFDTRLFLNHQHSELRQDEIPQRSSFEVLKSSTKIWQNGRIYLSCPDHDKQRPRQGWAQVWSCIIDACNSALDQHEQLNDHRQTKHSTTTTSKKTPKQNIHQNTKKYIVHIINCIHFSRIHENS